MNVILYNTESFSNTFNYIRKQFLVIITEFLKFIRKVSIIFRIIIVLRRRGEEEEEDKHEANNSF